MLFTITVEVKDQDSINFSQSESSRFTQSGRLKSSLNVCLYVFISSIELLIVSVFTSSY